MSKKAILVGEKQYNRGDKTLYTVTFVDDDEATLAGADTGADVVLTGYTAVAAANVAATDTVNAALAKLEARIVALEAP